LFNLIDIPWHMFWLPLIVAFVFSFLLTWVVKSVATRYKQYGVATLHQTHAKPMVRLGGIAIFLAFLVSFLIFLDLDTPRIGLILSISIIFLMGLIDDIFNLKVFFKVIFQLMAVAVAIYFGIHIDQVANPFGGVVILTQFWDICLTAIWLLLVTNALNMFDGLDGLASGVTSIFSVTLFWLSLFVVVNQPETAIIAIILLGVMLGFLRWNWHPAKIFMGDSGSNVLGFLIATLAIISGAKLATAALVLAFPIIDVAWAFIRRVRQNKNPFLPDKEHLHHRLLSVGVAHKNVVLIILSMVALLGFVSLLSGTKIKIFLMIGVAIFAILLIRSIIVAQRRKRS